MKIIPKVFLVLFFVLAVVSAALLFAPSPVITAQTKPLTYPEIITALNTKLPKTFFKTKADLLTWMIGEIKKRKIDKTLTADREEDLRQSGATDELIEVIRQNSPPPPAATPTPRIEPSRTPVLKPESSQTPTPAPTPTSMSTPDNSPPVKMEFVKIPSGSFEMGLADPDYGNTFAADIANRLPVHNVKLNGFQIQKTEVTQSQWLELMKEIPKNCKDWLYGPHLFGKNKPIVCVSWKDIQQFIQLMNAKKDGYKYRLPTEAEWEYAARAGETGDLVDDLDAVAWHSGNSNDTLHNVGTKKPNAWGLYDVLGNAAEWTNDWYDENYYANSPDSNPKGPATGAGHVLRGGSWAQYKVAVDFTFRFSDLPTSRTTSRGFRLVREKD